MRDFGALTAENIRRQWRSYVRHHLEHAEQLGRVWDAMSDPLSARHAAGEIAARHAAPCHFYALIRRRVGDTMQDGAALTLEARQGASRAAEARTRHAPDYGPNGVKERWN